MQKEAGEFWWPSQRLRVLGGHGATPTPFEGNLLCSTSSVNLVVKAPFSLPPFFKIFLPPWYKQARRWLLSRWGSRCRVFNISLLYFCKRAIPLRVWESRLVRTPSLTLGYTALKTIPGGKIKQKKEGGGLFFKACFSICPHQNKTTGPLKWRMESSQPCLLKRGVGKDRKEGRSQGGSLEHDTPFSPCRFNQV